VIPADGIWHFEGLDLEFRSDDPTAPLNGGRPRLDLARSPQHTAQADRDPAIRALARHLAHAGPRQRPARLADSTSEVDRAGLALCGSRCPSGAHRPRSDRTAAAAASALTVFFWSRTPEPPSAA
jgi:hypothetical protein